MKRREATRQEYIQIGRIIRNRKVKSFECIDELHAKVLAASPEDPLKADHFVYSPPRPTPCTGPGVYVSAELPFKA